MARNSSNPVIHVEARTWQRDIHDLFDYEATNVQANATTINESSSFVRIGNQVTTSGSVPTSTSSSYWNAPTEPLLNIKQSGHEFWVENPNAWVVVSDPQKLQEGDIIKLGRFQLLVKQLARTSFHAPPVPKFDLTNKSTKAGPTVCRGQGWNAETGEATCRYCLMPQQSAKDPLISPCHCCGGSKHVHLECLRNWLGHKMTSDQDLRKLYWQPPTCELCRADFSVFVEYDAGRLEAITALPKVDPPFVVLEQTSGTRGSSGPGLHIVSLAGNGVVSLGRGSDTEVHISDVSLSRWHAKIFLQDGQFMLRDNGSKFGTLLKLRQAQCLAFHQTINVQLGRTVVAVTMTNAVESVPDSRAIGSVASNRSSSRGGMVPSASQEVRNERLSILFFGVCDFITSKWQHIRSSCWEPIRL